jgi:hypothetical protein
MKVFHQLLFVYSAENYFKLSVTFILLVLFRGMKFSAFSYKGLFSYWKIVYILVWLFTVVTVDYVMQVSLQL